MNESEDSDVDDDRHEELVAQRTAAVLDRYNTEAAATRQDSDVVAAKFQQYILQDVLSGTQTCLICLESIRRAEAVWSCVACYNLYHLVCIQRWAQEGIRLARIQSDERISDEHAESSGEFDWCCPKCRYTYEQKECPKYYYCFCGQQRNPKQDLWNIPHSCGQVCSRKLTGCNHTCLVLCHPGPCPPCPKTLSVRCFCGKSPAVTRRCGASGWSCQRLCGKRLACGSHTCQQICHDGACSPCTERKVMTCSCGKHREQRMCDEQQWQCEERCGKPLGCGNHTCLATCHGGICPPCVGAGTTCPCGKTSYGSGAALFACINDRPCCGDTCEKWLACDRHRCHERCHRGSCPPCRADVMVKCRCGLKERNAQCGKEVLCETKCKRKRNCGRHSCNKKCCDGKCPPCEQPCGRTLNCGNHKCSSVCHAGMCYPCPVTAEVKCRCGAAVLKVPCGKEKKTRPPRCHQKCLIKPDCHHDEREPHRCHFGDCPPCTQVCNKQHAACKHLCAQPCHSAVLLNTAVSAIKPATPWEKPAVKLELVNLPCPPCHVPVPVTCLGLHETVGIACCEAKPFSCGRACGRPLACGNHTCQKMCHAVGPEATMQCDECNRGCDLKRAEGCEHACTKPCHPVPCPPCRQMIRRQCHCGLTPQLFIPCTQWCSASQDERLKLMACENRCPKVISCGHRCTKKCHADVCSSPESCEKKVNIYCKCKRRKVLVSCWKQSLETVDCDDECRRLSEERRAQDALREEQERKKREEERNREAEVMERKFGNAGRKRKHRVSSDGGQQENPWTIRLLLGMAVAVAFASFLYFGMGM